MKLFKLVAVLFVLVGLSIGSIFLYREFVMLRDGYSEYYKKLARRCGIMSFLPIVNENDCCFDSIGEVAKTGIDYIVDASEQGNAEGCPEGHGSLKLMCYGSMRFCVPNSKAPKFLNPVIRSKP